MKLKDTLIVNQFKYLLENLDHTKKKKTLINIQIVSCFLFTTISIISDLSHLTSKVKYNFQNVVKHLRRFKQLAVDRRIGIFSTKLTLTLAFLKFNKIYTFRVTICFNKQRKKLLF